MITAIAAVGLDWAIGRNGQLLVSIPADMKYFRETTKGATVIMGRQTYDSLPKKPLPNRKNIVISRSYSDFTPVSDNLTGSDLEHVKAYLEGIRSNPDSGDVFVIGGGQIYRELLDWCDTVLLTQVFQTWPDADTFFPNMEEQEGWILSDAGEMFEYEGLSYRFIRYEKAEQLRLICSRVCAERKSTGEYAHE